MLFISILLSVWFVLWLISAIHTKDVLHLIALWLDMLYGDEEDEDAAEEFEGLIEKAKTAEGGYHLNCDHCGHDWWTTDAIVNFCPNCGKKPHE